MEGVVAVARTATNATINEKMLRVKEARALYTYAGLLDQIEKWFRDPFGPKGGKLRCKGSESDKKDRDRKGEIKDLLVDALSHNT
jgi:hypothetical protein